jgi:hypothetical protein
VVEQQGILDDCATELAKLEAEAKELHKKALGEPDAPSGRTVVQQILGCLPSGASILPLGAEKLKQLEALVNDIVKEVPQESSPSQAGAANASEPGADLLPVFKADDMDLDDEILDDLAEAAVGTEEGEEENSSARAGRVAAAKARLVHKKRELETSLAKVKKIRK